MVGKNHEVYGTISGVEVDNKLLVELENGEKGCVEWEEISRQDYVRREIPSRLVGRHMGFVCTDVLENGRLVLSGRAFEERAYQKVCEDFQNKSKNVYIGQLTSITADGKLAFYQIAQGVTAALHVSSFSLCRVHSFRNIDLPKQLPVVVSEINERGWLSLSTKPTFGNFEYVVHRLSLSEGMVVDGVVSNILPDGALAVMLAPNLSVLLDACCRVDAGNRVRLRIRRIDAEMNRLRATMLERIEEENFRFDYEAWCRPCEELGEYVDIRAFEDSIRLKRSVISPSQENNDKEAQMEFTVNAQRSPFSTYTNERIVREVCHPSRIQDINFEARMGYLGERHLRIAEAVEALKYSSAWQIRRYLFLKEGLALSERELKGQIDRLVKHDIIGVLRFQSDEGSMMTRVLHPSLNYRAFCGHNPRNFSAKDFMESNASSVKMRLASNQLLIGLMHSWDNLDEVEPHPFLRCDEIQMRIRPRHMLRREEKRYYLEAIRKGWEQEICEKLQRYKMVFERRREDAEILIVVEDAQMLQAMAAQIADLKLEFTVRLTDDLNCLPEPKFTVVAATPKTLLQRLRSKLEEI